VPGDYDDRVNSQWLEVGERVYVRRYEFYDQNIVVVRGGRGALVVDTRATPAQARELLADIAGLGIHRVDVVVNTHGHHDHAFGNRQFRPAVIWGHTRCAVMIAATGALQVSQAAAELPEIADDLAAVVLDPPDRTFDDRAVIDLDGRVIDLQYLGRGHTDNDIVVSIPDADVLCAGDLVENGAPPSFGDGFPMDWPATVGGLLAMTGRGTVVVPGHGDHVGRSFVEQSLHEFQEIARRATLVHGGRMDAAEAEIDGPYPAAQMHEPLTRALAQLRGELGP
jgi:glyoxylase-like metal-dependent hydrolase (beta-lactamase superfamily II)